MSILSFCCRQRYASGVELNLKFETSARVTALCGPSGSGKSTTLALVAGLIAPLEGSIVLEGRALCDTASGVNLPPERRQVGLVMQDLLLFPHLSVAGNLQYGWRRRRNTAGPEVDFRTVVEVLELGPVLDRLPDELSGGQRQRVALGRALLSRPRMLLMDEPFAALDQSLRLRILDYLERVVERWNVPILYATHWLADVRRLAEHVVVIDGGRCVIDQAVQEAMNRDMPWPMDSSLGPVNLLSVTEVRAEDGHWIGQAGAAVVRLPPLAEPPQDTVWVEFAPRDVMLAQPEVQLAVSARNRLTGVVRQVVEAGGAVSVAVDVGQVVWAQITPESVRELELRPGAKVLCLIKTSSLRVIG